MSKDNLLKTEEKSNKQLRSNTDEVAIDAL